MAVCRLGIVGIKYVLFAIHEKMASIGIVSFRFLVLCLRQSLVVVAVVGICID